MDTNIPKALSDYLDQNPFLKYFFWIQEYKDAALACYSNFHDITLFRARKRSLYLANTLLTPKADLDKEALEKLIAKGEKEGFSEPLLEDKNDFLEEEHLLFFLKQLKKSPSLWNQIKSFDLPLCHPFAEKLIASAIFKRFSLGLNKRDLRLAVLSACMGYLRQNIGSCFATAPAILIHKQILEDFINDLFSLLKKGKLSRIFGGVEYSAPLIKNIGFADLQKPLSHKNQFACPGILDFCEITHLLDQNLNLENKIEYIELLGQKALEDTPSLTALAFLKRVLPLSSSQSDEEEAFFRFKSQTEDPLLKLWEFTLASFSEVKMEFSSWNLYTALGLNPEEKGGIGFLIQEYFQARLDHSNQEIEEAHKECVIAYEQLKGTEYLISKVSTEEQKRTLMAEHTVRLMHLQSCLDEKDRKVKKAKRFSTLYSLLIQKYCDIFPEYFQEVYDPSLAEGTSSYEDAPAGFRLVFKHGRTKANLWDPIENKEQYTEALIQFFKQSEYAIAHSLEEEDSFEILQPLTTQIIYHIQNKDFLQKALDRIRKAHKRLNNNEALPWAYISGGTLTTLIKTYFRREGDLTGESRYVENPLDLSIFILDTLKALAPRIMDPYLKKRQKRMLMQAPTHAFLLLPGLKAFSLGWQNNNLSYTWIRDQWITPVETFWQNYFLSEEEQLFFWKKFQEILRPFLLPIDLLVLPKKISLLELQAQLEYYLKDHPLLPELLVNLDSFIFSNCPLTPNPDSKLLIEDFLKEHAISLPSISLQPPFLTTKELKNSLLIHYIEARKTSFFSYDIQEEILHFCQKKQRIAPAAIPFADTNWPHFYFSFAVSPLQRHLQLWRTDRLGSIGSPMNSWNSSFGNTTPHPWTIYIEPSQWGG